MEPPAGLLAAASGMAAPVAAAPGTDTAAVAPRSSRPPAGSGDKGRLHGHNGQNSTTRDNTPAAVYSTSATIMAILMVIFCLTGTPPRRAP